MRNVSLVTFISLLLLWTSLASADDATTFKVQEGAFPWSDRINVWTLGPVPDNLKSNAPLPQQSCSSKSLIIPGTPQSITVGVSERDAKAFQEKFPTSKDTGDTVMIQKPDGTNQIPYKLFTLDNPPEKIDGTGVYSAGLLLLKVVPAASTSQPSTGK